MANNRTGRPTKLTPEVQQRIVVAVSAGNTRATSAAYAGVGRATFLAWLAKGAVSSSGLYRDFLDAIEKAEANAVAQSVALIRQAAQESWQAAAWWLERRYPDEWGRKDRIELETIIRRESEKVAEETGLNAEDVFAAVEAIINSH